MQRLSPVLGATNRFFEQLCAPAWRLLSAYYIVLVCSLFRSVITRYRLCGFMDLDRLYAPRGVTLGFRYHSIPGPIVNRNCFMIQANTYIPNSLSHVW